MPLKKLWPHNISALLGQINIGSTYLSDLCVALNTRLFRLRLYAARVE